MPLTLGHRKSLNRAFKGAIDDLRLFDQTLSADEIYDLFMASRP